MWYTVLLCNYYCSHKIIVNLNSWLWCLWSHDKGYDKGVLCPSTDFVELKHTKQLFCKLRVQLMHIKHCQKFFSVCGDHVVKKNLSFCNWWRCLEKMKCIPMSIFTFAMGCLFCFCIFSHSANNIQEPMVHIWQVQFLFFTSKYGNIGSFFQKILLEKLQPLSSVTKRQKSSLLRPPPSSPPSKKYSDCKN